MRRINWNWTVRLRTATLFCLVASATQPARPNDNAPSTPDDRTSYTSCRHCGMDRSQFAQSRLLITYSDGMVAGVCSIHCGALDLALNISRYPRTIQAGDYRTRDLIDGETAHWVLGGKKPGVMTRRAKWAFLSKETADEFIREHGGRLTDFSGALKGSYEDMYGDVTAIRKKRAKRP